MDWFPAVMTLVGVLVGLGFQEFRFRRERKDRYKDMIFEKRLEAHQGAYHRCFRLLEFMFPYRLMRGGGEAALLDEMVEYSDWLNKNTLYLDRDSRTKINLLFDYAMTRIEKYRDKEWVANINVKEEMVELSARMVEVVVSISKGVGVEYLPEGKLRIEGGVVQRIVRDAVERMEEMVRREQKEGGEKGEEKGEEKREEEQKG